MRNLFLHRILQLVGLLLGVRFFRLIFVLFSLYTFTFFLIGKERLWNTIVDIKIHGIVLCAILSVAAGSLINQFYDKEKDEIIKPFRSRWQNFLRQKYVLYFYLIFNLLSLTISLFLSWRIFLFFLIYQFLIWFYSHKISKMLIINNLMYVLLSLYPFFGILIYYKYFSINIFLLSVFLFLLFLCIDIIKDLLTIKGDGILNYKTLPIIYGKGKTIFILRILLSINISNLGLMLIVGDWDFYSYYLVLSIIYFLGMMFFLQKSRMGGYFVFSVFLKIWVFIGILFMFVNSVF